MNLLPCPFCGSHSEMVERYSKDYGTDVYYVRCVICNCMSDDYFSETEAIEAWNRRVVTDTNDGSKERMVNVVDHEYRIGTSLNIVGEPKIGHEYLCGACNKKVLSGDNYCSHCGVKLDWSE